MPYTGNRVVGSNPTLSATQRRPEMASPEGQVHRVARGEVADDVDLATPGAAAGVMPEFTR